MRFLHAPGMIMVTKALLDAHPDPSEEDKIKALRGNLCRCTGNTKIIEVVQLASRFLRGELSPESLKPLTYQGGLGIYHPRPSALAKACGTAHLTADFCLQGALELAVLRSTLPHARIVTIDSTVAKTMPVVVGVLTAADIKGTNILKYLVAERPLLCKEKVRYNGDPILAVAAETRFLAETTLAAIKEQLEPLSVLDSPRASLAEGAAQRHDEFPNLYYDQPQINHEAPLEPEATIAYWENCEDAEEEDKLVIIGGSINIHFHLAMLQAALGWENMKYIEAYSGGQFGIKIDVISEGIAGTAALHFHWPYIPSIAETMLMTLKRHSFALDVALAADKDGPHRSIGHEVAHDAVWLA